MMNKKRLPPGILPIQFLILMSYSSLAILALLPLFFEHLGGNRREIGFLVGLFSLAAFFSRPFAGWLLSKYCPRKVLIGRFVLILSMTTLYLLINSLNWFVVFIRIFHGIGFSIAVLAALLIVVLKVGREERAYAIGVVSTGFMLPLLVVPYIGEVIIERMGFFYFFLSAIALVAIPFFYAIFKKISVPQFSEDPSVQSTGFFRLLGRKKIFLIFSLTFIFEVALSSSISFVPLLVHEHSSMRAGYYYTFIGLSTVFMRLYAGRKLKFWGSPMLILPAFCFLSGGGVLIYLSYNNFLLAISGLISGIGVGILYPHLSAMVVEGIASSEKGKVLSLFASSVDLGFAMGPIAFGWISQALELRITFVLFALFAFLSSFLLIVWGRSELFERKD
ncbi:MAG: MFS transporter [Candidatus Aminicenantes bacterium]|nr:MAG: MFS transporter [Candidatus Aminicenantes bacterium]